MDCIIHYDGYCDAEEKLLLVSKDSFDRLQEAKTSREKLGGDNLSSHSKQIKRLPEAFKDGQHFHIKCYKKFTFAISTLMKAREKHESEAGPSRVKRKGESGQTLFPNHCMICKKAGKKYVKGQSTKQPARLI